MKMQNLFSIEKAFEKKDDIKRCLYSYKKDGKDNDVEFYDYFDQLEKHGFEWKDGFISYEVKLSSDKKNIIKTFKHNYDRKILADEMSRVLMHYRGNQKDK